MKAIVITRPGGLFFLVVMSVVFFKWASHEHDDPHAVRARAF